MTGYIKLYRKIAEKGWYKDSECVHLWVHLLMKANHKGAEFMHGYNIVKLLPGQLVTGRKALSIETGISESKVERILNMFEIEQQIEQQTNSRNRVITILSWESYQQSEQQVDSRRTASEQPANTNNNEKNNKNDKNDKKGKAALATLDLPFKSEKFKQAWEDLTQEPNWKNKTLNSYKKTLELLSKLNEDAAIAAIDHTVANGYKGIFPEKFKANNGAPKPYTEEANKFDKLTTENFWGER